MTKIIHVWIRTETDGFEHKVFNSFREATETLTNEKIIAMLAEDMVIDFEVTYEQPSNPYNKTIWWNRKNMAAAGELGGMTTDEFLAQFDGLGEE